MWGCVWRTRWQVVKTPTIISNNPVYSPTAQLKLRPSNRIPWNSSSFSSVVPHTCWDNSTVSVPTSDAVYSELLPASLHISQVIKYNVTSITSLCLTISAPATCTPHSRSLNFAKYTVKLQNLNLHRNAIYTYIQGVTGRIFETSGECSLC